MNRQKIITTLKKSIAENWEKYEVSWVVNKNHKKQEYRLSFDIANKGNEIYEDTPSGTLIVKEHNGDTTLETHVFGNREELNMWLQTQMHDLLENTK